MPCMPCMSCVCGRSSKTNFETTVGKVHSFIGIEKSCQIVTHTEKTPSFRTRRKEDVCHLTGKNYKMGKVFQFPWMFVIDMTLVFKNIRLSVRF